MPIRCEGIGSYSTSVGEMALFWSRRHRALPICISNCSICPRWRNEQARDSRRPGSAVAPRPSQATFARGNCRREQTSLRSCGWSTIMTMMRHWLFCAASVAHCLTTASCSSPNRWQECPLPSPLSKPISASRCRICSKQVAFNSPTHADESGGRPLQPAPRPSGGIICTVVNARGMSRVHSLPSGPRFANIAMINALRDACTYYARCAKRFGDPFTLPTPFGPLVMTGRPEGIRAIYSAEPESVEIFVKEPVPFLGPTSLVQSSGRQHIRRRQVIMPFLSRSSLIDYCAAISDIAARFAAGLKPGDHFVAQHAMHELSLQVILRIFFGVEFAQLQAVREAFLTAQRAMHPSFIFFGLLRRRFFGLGPWARVCRARETLDATIHAVIAGRRAGQPCGGFLDLLLDARFADGSPMSDMGIPDQLLTPLAGGP